MFEEFYEMYEPEEQEVVALINRCIGRSPRRSVTAKRAGDALARSRSAA